jgi:hypothetical protein
MTTANAAQITNAFLSDADTTRDDSSLSLMRREALSAFHGLVAEYAAARFPEDAWRAEKQDALAYYASLLRRLGYNPLTSRFVD